MASLQESLKLWEKLESSILMLNSNSTEPENVLKLFCDWAPVLQELEGVENTDPYFLARSCDISFS